MAYSENPATLIQMLPYLAGLARGEDHIKWELKRGEEQRWAYRVREALHIVRKAPDHAPALAAQAERYTIKVDSRLHQVHAIRKNSEVLVSETTGAAAPTAVIQSVNEARLVRMPPIPGAQTAASIIGVLVGHPVTQPINYPDAGLTPDDLTKLRRWAAAQEPRLMVLVVDSGVTIAPHDPELADA